MSLPDQEECVPLSLGPLEPLETPEVGAVEARGDGAEAGRAVRLGVGFGVVVGAVLGDGGGAEARCAAGVGAAEGWPGAEMSPDGRAGVAVGRAVVEAAVCW